MKIRSTYYQMCLTIRVVLGQFRDESGGFFANKLVRRIQASLQNLKATELVKIVGLQIDF